MNETYVTKQRKTQHSEPFNPVKLHKSIVEACFSVRAFEGEAHLTAERVCKAVLDWIITKKEVTSEDIRRLAGFYLEKYHPEAAYVYEHEKVMI